MPKAMIVSLGGSPQPVIVAIDYYKPSFVCFFASTASVELVHVVKQGVRWQDFGSDNAIAVDANDLLHCYAVALEAARIVAGQGFAPTDVVVDYTGGTKSMTGALVLATVARGYTFSYVGGDIRTKGGLGQVIDGSERVFEVLNPWEVLAVGERQRLAWLFNHHEFAAACELLETVRAKARHEARLGQVFACLSDVVQGYAAWDRFAHREAGKHLREGLKGVSNCAILLQDEGLKAFVAQMETSLAFFNRLTEESAGFHLLCAEMIVDIIANAQRRATEGKYDDAVARLYRALEMAAQHALERRDAPIRTGSVLPEQVPPDLRDEFTQRYSGRVQGVLQLPLYASFRLLQAFGDPLGQRFMDMEERMTGLLSARNSSILAHGVVPLDRGTWESLLGGLLTILDIRQDALPAFPKMVEGG